MRIQVVTPVAAGAVIGNQQTARRYARILRRLGHRVAVTASHQVGSSDLLIALHARRSYPAIQRFAAGYPARPLILVLTGTDVYRDIHSDTDAQHALELATRLVVLQQHALTELPERLRAKTRVIYQSAPCFRAQVSRPATAFRVCVVGHLRPEKDPLRTALAARHLPASSRIRIVHAGAALDAQIGSATLQESATNPRYQWLGGLPHSAARRLVAGSHLLSITSLLEGSCNVLSEALTQASPTPVVASRIGGLIGTLGEDYPGYYPPRNTLALAELLQRAEGDASFYAALQAHTARVAPLVRPDHEQDALAALLAELT
jgi:putative glycosyltransferase (TIGR04348 family)